MNVADANGLLPTGAIRSADGEVVVPASRRADGSLRKPIRIRKGYVPLEEVPKYKTVGQRVRVLECLWLLERICNGQNLSQFLLILVFCVVYE